MTMDEALEAASPGDWVMCTNPYYTKAPTRWCVVKTDEERLALDKCWITWCRK